MRHCNSTTLTLTLLMFIAGVATCQVASQRRVQTVNIGPTASPSPTIKSLPDNAPPQLKQMLEGAIAQAGVTTGYDPAYVALEYPGGDVPEKTGVCSDVVVRAFRKAGIDLQKEVHEDIKSARSAYPTKWGANAPDKNIDHRRVLNLMTYFTRQRKSLSISNNAADYQPGDVVSWELTSGIDHIGIVTNMLSESADRYLIVHNIGAGARIEDVMFAWTIKGHYRYF
ncbi:MAG TPA: DUF1287 domain-containing protein [Pyrinomonadaceae bacterium]|nr:DUF1287 domain-containing protein [Pyrinomonadaceae bacterium]